MKETNMFQTVKTQYFIYYSDMFQRMFSLCFTNIKQLTVILSLSLSPDILLALSPHFIHPCMHIVNFKITHKLPIGSVIRSHHCIRSNIT